MDRVLSSVFMWVLAVVLTSPGLHGSRCLSPPSHVAGHPTPLTLKLEPGFSSLGM